MALLFQASQLGAIIVITILIDQVYYADGTAGDNDNNSDDNYLAKMSDKKNQDDPGGCHRPYSIIH